MKAVFQGPGPAVQTAQAPQIIDVPVEVKPASHASVRPGMTHPAQSFAGATIPGAAPLRFTAMPQTAGSYILPASGCADPKSFEQQAQAQAQALLQAQRLAGTQDQLGTVKFSSSIQMPVANGGYHMPPTPSAASPGSYMPPPGVGSGQLMPSPGSFVPPPQNGSFVPPPVSPCPLGGTQPLGSISMPAMPMGSLSCPPGGCASACGSSGPGPCGPGPCGPSGPLGPCGPGGPCGLGGPCAGPFAGPCAGPCGTGSLGPGPCGSYAGGVPLGASFSGASATAPPGPMGGPLPGCSGFPGLPGLGLAMPQLPTAHLPPPMMPSLAHPGPGFMPPSPAQFGHAPPGALGL